MFLTSSYLKFAVPSELVLKKTRKIFFNSLKDKEDAMNITLGTVLITGCSSGIGHALSMEFNRRKYIVYATARNVESISSLKEEGINTQFLDVNDEESVKTVVKRIEIDHGRIDILVNNAGYGSMGPSLEISTAELRRQFETNVFAPMNLIQEVVPGMIHAKQGLIVNMGSVSGILATPFSGVYCASKAALHYLSDALRMELVPFGIKVITVQPGRISSNFGKIAKLGVVKNIKSDSVYTSILDAIHARADMSQLKSTSPEYFSRKLINELQKENPKHIMRIGKSSSLLPFIKRYFPSRVSDKILSKKFKLDKL